MYQIHYITFSTCKSVYSHLRSLRRRRRPSLQRQIHWPPSSLRISVFISENRLFSIRKRYYCTKFIILLFFYLWGSILIYTRISDLSTAFISSSLQLWDFRKIDSFQLEKGINVPFEIHYITFPNCKSLIPHHHHLQRLLIQHFIRAPFLLHSELDSFSVELGINVRNSLYNFLYWRESIITIIFETF